MAELALIQIPVESVLFKKFSVISLLDDLSVFHDQDQVRLPDGRKAVCHDKRGPPLHQFRKGVLDLDLRSGING